MKSNIRCAACNRKRKQGHEDKCGTEKAYNEKCVILKKFDGKAYRAELKKLAKEKAEVEAIAIVKAREEREAKEKVDKDAKEKEMAEAKAKEEQEAKEKADKEVIEKDAQKVQKKAEREARIKAAQEAKEKAEAEAEAEARVKQETEIQMTTVAELEMVLNGTPSEIKVLPDGSITVEAPKVPEIAPDWKPGIEVKPEVTLEEAANNVPASKEARGLTREEVKEFRPEDTGGSFDFNSRSAKEFFEGDKAAESEKTIEISNTPIEIQIQEPLSSPDIIKPAELDKTQPETQATSIRPEPKTAEIKEV